MIDFYNQVPTVYVKASRDFQYLCWLFNIVLNDVKHNVDDISHITSTKADSKLTELLAFTLGFKVRRNYDNKQLAALVSIIPSILRNKGTKKAVMLAGNALITAAGSTSTFSAKVIDNVLEVLLPEDLVDVTLFIDLLPYILPAGMSCRIVRKAQKEVNATTRVHYHDNVLAKWHQDLSWNTETETVDSLSSLYNTTANEPNFANFTADGLLNGGLLENAIIPILPGKSIQPVSQEEPINTASADDEE